MTSLRAFLADAYHALTTAVWGPHCRLGCGARVYDRDVAAHEDVEHAGDVAGGVR